MTIAISNRLFFYVFFYLTALVFSIPLFGEIVLQNEIDQQQSMSTYKLIGGNIFRIPIPPAGRETLLAFAPSKVEGVFVNLENLNTGFEILLPLNKLHVNVNIIILATALNSGTSVTLQLRKNGAVIGSKSFPVKRFSPPNTDTIPAVADFDITDVKKGDVFSFTLVTSNTVTIVERIRAPSPTASVVTMTTDGDIVELDLTVQNINNNQPIDQADVKISKPPFDHPVIQEGFTNELGIVKLLVFRMKQYFLTVSKPGFLITIALLDDSGKPITQATIKLKPLPSNILPPQNLNVEFLCCKDRGSDQVLTFDKSPSGEITEYDIFITDKHVVMKHIKTLSAIDANGNDINSFVLRHCATSHTTTYTVIGITPDGLESEPASITISY